MKKINYVFVLVFGLLFLLLFLQTNTKALADHCGADTNYNVECSDAAIGYKCDSGEMSGSQCGGSGPIGAIPSDENVENSPIHEKELIKEFDKNSETTSPLDTIYSTCAKWLKGEIQSITSILSPKQ